MHASLRAWMPRSVLDPLCLPCKKIHDLKPFRRRSPADKAWMTFTDEEVLLTWGNEPGQYLLYNSGLPIDG
jgi:hypothetical protein